MPTFEFSESVAVSPDRVLAALTDFGPGRPQLFPNSAEKYFVLHAAHDTFADVTEGSSGVWERLHYDWTNPRDVRLTTVDSNTWGGDSGHRWQLRPRAGGGTQVDVTVVRDPKNVRGHLVSGLLRLSGRRLIGGQLRGLLRTLEETGQGSQRP